MLVQDSCVCTCARTCNCWHGQSRWGQHGRYLDPNAAFATTVSREDSQHLLLSTTTSRVIAAIIVHAITPHNCHNFSKTLSFLPQDLLNMRLGRFRGLN